MRRAGAAFLLAGSLAGCAGGGENFFTPSTNGGGSTFGNLLAFNTADPGPVPAAASREPPLQCPQIEVQDGTAAIRNYNGADQSSGNLRYQFSLGDIARECSKIGNQISIKIGVEGRVLLGPAGQTGNFTAPVRIAVRRDSDQKAVATRLYQIPATIQFGQTQGDFALVADPLTIPFIHSDANEDYTILVGFDEHGAAPAAKAKKGRKANPG